MKEKKYIVAFFFAITYTLFSGASVSADYEPTTEMKVCGEGRFKSFMSMTALGKNSPQYKYLVKNTKDENNLRVTKDGYYAVAMGSYYGKLGDKFIITFESGKTLKVVKVDEKASKHTSSSCKGMTMASDGSIIEGITSYGTKANKQKERKLAKNKKLYDKMFLHGTLGKVYPDLFAGNEKIIKINKIKEASLEPEKPKQNDKKPLSRHSEISSGRLASLNFLTEGGFSSMYVYIPNNPQDKIVFLDTEFTDNQELVQAAFITFTRIDDKQHFFLTSSLNVYVNTLVSEGFENYTGIKQGFLGNEGLTKYKALEVIQKYIDENGINKGDSIIVGHGLRQDIIVLRKFGCEIDACQYDTYSNAKRLLNRDHELKLSNLLHDAGYYQGAAHDAYQDTRDLIPIYGYLKRIEESELEE